MTVTTFVDRRNPRRGGGPGAVRLQADDRRPFFTPKSLAAYLAISERTVRQMIADRRLPSYRVEGQRRIDAADVDAYLVGRRDDAG